MDDKGLTLEELIGELDAISMELADVLENLYTVAENLSANLETLNLKFFAIQRALDRASS